MTDNSETTDVAKTVSDLERFVVSPKYADIVDRVTKITYEMPVPVKSVTDAIFALIDKTYIGVSMKVPAKASQNNRVGIPRLGDLCCGVTFQLFPSERIVSAKVRIRVEDKSEWLDFGNYATINGATVEFNPPLPILTMSSLGLEIKIADRYVYQSVNYRRDCLLDYVFIQNEIRDELSRAIYPDAERVRASDFTAAHCPTSS